MSANWLDKVEKKVIIPKKLLDEAHQDLIDDFMDRIYSSWKYQSKYEYILSRYMERRKK